VLGRRAGTVPSQAGLVEWLAQVRRAADPSWRIGGLALEKLLPQAVAFGVTIAALVALWFVPRDRAGSWVGVLAVVGAVSLHIYGILFMLGAWLLVRREIGLIAAMLVAWFTVPGVWGGVLLVAATWALGATRWPGLLEPARRGAPSRRRPSRGDGAAPREPSGAAQGRLVGEPAPALRDGPQGGQHREPTGPEDR
jgi:hypothetical protein